MPHLLCKTCGEGKIPGTRQALPATPEDRAEYERNTRGIAKQPTLEQRTVYFNGEPIIPSTKGELTYVCDLCSAEIRPGDECWAWTVWLDGQPEPGDWESEYLERV